MCADHRVGIGMRSCRDAGSSPGTPFRSACTERGAYLRWDHRFLNLFFTMLPQVGQRRRPGASEVIRLRTTSMLDSLVRRHFSMRCSVFEYYLILSSCSDIRSCCSFVSPATRPTVTLLLPQHKVPPPLWTVTSCR